MEKPKSSEEKFGIMKQPWNTCPYIDDFLKSVVNIGDEDEDGEIIAVSPDYSALKDAQRNVEELQSWQKEWIEVVGENLIERFQNIIEAHKKEEQEKKLSFEEEALLFFFKDIDNVIYLKESIFEHLVEWNKEIKLDMWDLESLYSSVESLADNQDISTLSEAENYRSRVSDFRNNGNHYKELIRDTAQEYLFDKYENIDIEEAYEIVLEKEEEEKIKKDLISKLNKNKNNNDNSKNTLKV